MPGLAGRDAPRPKPGQGLPIKGQAESVDETSGPVWPADAGDVDVALAC
jgi:hypothetical protein